MKRIQILLAFLLSLSLLSVPAAFASGESSAEVEKNGEIYVLVTSDVHCAVDQGWGYAGLYQIRQALEAQGYETILVDDGDSVQGEYLGLASKGEYPVELMNAMDYDVAIPGNHEFDYGMEEFLHLVEMADYPYISCNFTYMGELVLEPYTIVEAAGRKIGFVGVCTPESLTTSTPSFFQDENGNFIYGFMQDETGEAVYEAVQNAVDAARAEGAELVYVMGHLGYYAESAPWSYADVVEHTSGYDVFLDGHSHDSEQVVMKNRDGEDVARCAVGTKLNGIGYSHISADGEVLETGLWSWPNSISAPELFGIENEISLKVGDIQDELAGKLETVLAYTSVDLTINDPVAKDDAGNPMRAVRLAETNLGDLCTDAYRERYGADIAILNGGCIRASIAKGEITYNDIINVHPYGNTFCMIEATGQQILDALEWGARSVPGESGAFMQVSGLTYEIHTGVESSCTSDETGMFTGVTGEYRVKNVMVGDEPLDLEKTYTVAGNDYILLEDGDGCAMFDGAAELQTGAEIDSDVLVNYIVETLGGTVGAEYADPYGQGRIVIVED